MDNDLQHDSGDVNPYIPLADLMINLVLVLALVVATLNIGWENVRYQPSQKQFKAEILRSFPPGQRPYNAPPDEKNDPPGTQRWVFVGQSNFAVNSSRLLPCGKATLTIFARVLAGNKRLWRRVRIEGHTRPTAGHQTDDWDLSARRATAVAEFLSTVGHIPSYYLAVSGRGGQSPIAGKPRNDPSHERVEIVIEYAKMGAIPGN